MSAGLVKHFRTEPGQSGGNGFLPLVSAMALYALHHVADDGQVDIAIWVFLGWGVGFPHQPVGKVMSFAEGVEGFE